MQGCLNGLDEMGMGAGRLCWSQGGVAARWQLSAEMRAVKMQGLWLSSIPRAWVASKLYMTCQTTVSCFFAFGFPRKKTLETQAYWSF
jgi:hypothetical protein